MVKLRHKDIWTGIDRLAAQAGTGLLIRAAEGPQQHVSLHVSAGLPDFAKCEANLAKLALSAYIDAKQSVGPGESKVHVGQDLMQNAGPKQQADAADLSSRSPAAKFKIWLRQKCLRR